MASQLTAHEVPQILPPELRPDVSQLVTEDDTPVDNIFAEKQQRLLTEPLYSSGGDPSARRPFVAMANVGLFNSIHDPPYVPDMLLSMDVIVPADVWEKSHRSYFVWEYGKRPEVVVEVVSNREGGEESEKLLGYAQIGIPYYVIFDPEQWLSNEVLRAFELRGIVYQRLTEPIWFHDVGLGLRLWRGAFEGLELNWLRWVDADDQPIPTGGERADRERFRAEQERDRAERLAAQLRRLGAEPER